MSTTRIAISTPKQSLDVYWISRGLIKRKQNRHDLDKTFSSLSFPSLLDNVDLSEKLESLQYPMKCK
jgi:hypothetical protein